MDHPHVAGYQQLSVTLSLKSDHGRKCVVREQNKPSDIE